MLVLALSTALETGLSRAGARVIPGRSGRFSYRQGWPELKRSTVLGQLGETTERHPLTVLVDG